jgi:hypothetical protein
LVAVWVLVGALVAGCSSSPSSRGDEDASAGGDGFAATAADVQGASGGGGSAAGQVSASPAAEVVPPATGPRIVKKADVEVEVGRAGVGRAVDRATTIAERHGGYVAATAVLHGDDASSATLTVRVPAAAFDAARRELSGLGQVTEERLSGDDVTGQLVDHDARIRSLEAQEDALRTLLGRANAVGEVLQVQGQLFEVRRQIEQLAGQRAALADAADVSTITLRLVEPGAATRHARRDHPSTGLARSVERSWDAAVAVVGGMLIALGVAVPLAAVVLVAWLVRHLGAWRRRPVVDAS